MQLHNNNRFTLRNIAATILLLGLTACSSSSDSPDTGSDPTGNNGGIIIGTGKTLEGTTTSNKLFASNSIEVRSSSGQKFAGTFGNQGRFKVENINDTGPWLLRSDLGNNNYLYGIATNTSENAVVQNVHSYSDAIVRSWYATQGLDIDSVFASTDGNTPLPTDADVTAIYNGLSAVVGDVINNYGLSGVDLNRVEFSANGTGVDQFILQNPVIRNEDSITVIIFDPDNESASVAIESLSLNTDLAAADSVAPSSPTELRALPSASDEITLVWDVASDNIGIARYAIFRDGQQIATSPYPVFVDGGLMANTQFTYNVVAIDAADNESNASAVASASPLGAIDTTPPPTPASVLIDTRRGSLDLSWNQTGINDVASYTITRGTSPDNLLTYVNVNSTFLFDEAVNAGVQYCYQISAVDASGNASAPTGLVCATAPGALVSGNTTRESATPTGDGLTAPQLDVSDMQCTTAFPNSAIRTDTTLAAGCYLATTSISVLEPANLTLEPGVVIKFSALNTLTVSQGASITARGTASKPIVLTGVEPTPGHWQGVSMQSSSAKNVFDHVQIEYAGNSNNGTGGLRFFVLGSNARLAMSNSTVRFNAGPGLEMGNNMSLSTFEGNRYTGNTVPVLAPNAGIALLDKRSSYVGNTLDAVIATANSIEQDTIWPALPVPIHSDGVLVSTGNFSMEAGTNVLFDKNASITVQPDATLSLVGTENNPITLSGINEAPGSWIGLNYVFSDNNNELRYVTLQHAGGTDELDAAINVNANSVATTRLSLSNVTIMNNANFGISAGSEAEFPEFSNITITGNDKLANMGIYAAQVFNNPGNFTGNGLDAIQLGESSLVFYGDVELSNATVPYYAGDISSTNTITLEAGVSMLMDINSIIEIYQNGALISNGTAAEPVTLTGRMQLPGYWVGLEYFLATNPLNRLTHTVVSYGGGTTGAGGIDNSANVHFRCSANNPTRMTIENSSMENSLGYGLFVQGTGCQIDIDAETTFISNASGDTN